MIKLERPFSPYRLSRKRNKEIIKEFLKSGKKKAVWKKSEVKKIISENLGAMSNEKCAYCECKLVEGGNFMHVEHFYPKDIYPTSVLAWKNLFPSCGRCNGNGGKGNHDTKTEPILNPANDFSNQYLAFNIRTFQIVEIDNNILGETTIRILGLNSSQRLVMVRKRIIEMMCQVINDMYDEINRCLTYINNDSDFTNKIILQMKGLLVRSNKNSQYSAVIGASLFNNNTFLSIKCIFEQNNIWNEQMNQLFEQGSLNSFSIVT